MVNISSIPVANIELDNQVLDDIADRALRDICIKQKLSAPTLCILTFVEPETTDFINRANLLPGTRLNITLPSNQRQVFSGVIKSFDDYYGPSGERVITVNANDDLYPLTRNQPVRNHIQLTVTELAVKLVSGHAISVVADETGPVWDNIVQFQTSDLDFLRDYSERSGLYFFLRDNVLYFFSLAPKRPDVTLIYRQSLLEFRVGNNVDWQTDSVAVKGWNPWRSTAQSGDAQTANNQTPGHQTELTASRTITDRPAQSDNQLEAYANANLLRMTAGQASVSGTAEGNLLLYPGCNIQIEGLKESFDNTYLLTSVEHRINPEQGFISLFDSFPPEPVIHPGHSQFTLGTVTQVEDPEVLGRVKVLLPAIEELESDWLEVLIPGAGENKGFIALPDIGDRVLVAFLDGRPDQAIVLGGLYGEAGPPDQNVDDNKVFRFSILTPGGQKVRLNDQDNSITVENRRGCRLQVVGDTIRLKTCDDQLLEMHDELIRLHAETDLEIEAPGNSITFRADKINFERG